MYTLEERQRLQRYPNLSRPKCKIYTVAWDSYGPIRIGARYVPWNEALIGVQGDTWEIVDWGN